MVKPGGGDVLNLKINQLSAQPGLLFAALFVAAFMNTGVIEINIGPLTNASVPAAIAATATGS